MGTAKPATIRSRVRKAGRGMTEGLFWVECYLPFDPQAFARFVQKWRELGSAEAVERADPELARKALTPIDTQGEGMLAEHLVALAHGFLVESRKIDVMHDERARGSLRIVESFVNGPEVESPHFWPGAWVAVIKADPGTPEFAALERGDLDAVSFQALVHKTPITARIA